MDINELVELIKQNTEAANAKVINYLSNSNFDINNFFSGNSLLTISISENNLQIFNYLLNRDVDILKIPTYISSKRGLISVNCLAAINLAIESNKIEFLDRMLDNLSNKSIPPILNNEEYDCTICHSNLTIDIAKILSKYSYEFSAYNVSMAIYWENIELLKYYIKDLKFDLNTIDNYGFSLLHYSISASLESTENNQLIITKYLVKKGIDIENFGYWQGNAVNILQRAMYEKFLFSKSILYLIKLNINYDVIDYFGCSNKNFLNYFLDQRCSAGEQAMIRFKIFEQLMIKQFFKHNQIFKQTPENYRIEVHNHVEEIIKDRNTHLGIDEYSRQVIIRNPSKPIKEIMPKYYLTLCKNHEKTNFVTPQCTEKTAKPNPDSLFSTKSEIHINSLKISAAMAIDADDIYDYFEKRLVPQDLVPYVIAVKMLEPFLTGESVDVVIDQ